MPKNFCRELLKMKKKEVQKIPSFHMKKIIQPENLEILIGLKRFLKGRNRASLQSFKKISSINNQPKFRKEKNPKILKKKKS